MAHSIKNPVYTISLLLASGNPSTAKMTAGSIYYLPPHNPLSNGRQPAADGIHPGIYNHPVLILSVDPWRSTADFLVISSLDGKSLDEYTSSQRCRDAHVPIFPNEPHPDNGSIVYLEADWALPKQSYIKMSPRLTVPQEVLKPLFDQQTGRQFRLRDGSFQDIKRMSISPSRRSPRSSSPTSFSSWSSSTSSIRSFGSPSPPPSPPRPVSKLWLKYSQEELLSLRPAALRKPGLLARLHTVDFDLTRRPSHRSAPSPELSTMSLKTMIRTRDTSLREVHAPCERPVVYTRQRWVAVS
ncbi:MAG: hypothetical protein L6R39_006842 [Caloplaca ligustica]|nr:MAG: hypothetical protein L6R39_006842 [Caloplaca ligustica]